MEYCVQAWDNLPRKLMMYLSNVANPLESYFHTILCNTPDLQHTIVNNHLRYIVWKSSTDWEPQPLSMSDFDKMLASGAVFARPFGEDDPVLDKVDQSVINRPPNGFVSGGWCSPSRGVKNTSAEDRPEEVCARWGNINTVKPGTRGINLRVLLSRLAAEKGRMKTNQCQEQ